MWWYFQHSNWIMSITPFEQKANEETKNPPNRMKLTFEEWCSNQLTWHGMARPSLAHTHSMHTDMAHIFTISWSVICRSKSLTPSLCCWIVFWHIRLLCLPWCECNMCFFFFAKLYCEEWTVNSEHPSDFNIYLCISKCALNGAQHEKKTTIETKNN